MGVSKIRWQNKDKKELQKAIRNFNSKIKRLEKEENQLELPETISFKETKKEILTRNDLNKFINSLKRFSKRGAEKAYLMKSGLIVTKWERNELGLQSRISQVKLQNEIKRLQTQEVTIAGKGTGFTYAKMGNRKIAELKAKINSIKNIENKIGQDYTRMKDRLKRYSRSSRDIARDTNYKNHYLNALDLSFGNMRGKKELLAKLKAIPASDFYDLINSDDFLVDFVTFYDFKGNQNVLDKLLEGWETVLNTDIYSDNYSDYNDSDYENREE